MSDTPKFGIDADQPADKPAFGPGAGSTPAAKPAFGPGAGSDPAAKPAFGPGAGSAPAAKPAFGPGAGQPTAPAADAEQPADPAVTPAPAADQPQFGAAAAHSGAAADKSAGDWVRDIFAMQPSSFWVKQYGYALLAFLLVGGMGGSWWLGVINLIMYPFTVTILQEIGRGKGEKSTLGAFFFGFSVGMIGESIWWIVAYGLIRLAIFLFKFVFSFLIGTVGLIYMVNLNKKLGH